MSRRRVAALGFAVSRNAERPPRQVLVIAEVQDAAAATAAVEAGADVLLHTGSADALAGVVQAAGTCAVGFHPGAAPSAADAKGASEAGAHFLVFDDRQTEAPALLTHGLGYVAAIETDDPDLRLLRPLDLDAALIPAPAERLTVREQLRVRRVGELLRKPLIARIDHAVDATTLEVWRDAGVLAVVSPSDAAILQAVITAADAVPRPRESSERPEVTVPSVQSSFDEEDEEI